MKAPPLQIGDNRRQRVRGAANADVQQNDAAVEFGVAFGGNAINEELRTLCGLDSIKTVEGPLD